MIRRLAVASIAAAAALTLAASAAAEEHDHHVGTLQGLRVIHAWTRATDGGTAYVFCDIENSGARDAQLIGGDSAVGSDTALVGFRLNSAGEGVYEILPSIPVKAGGKMALMPEGAAIRLDGLGAPLEQGDEFEIELEFDTGHMEIHVSVEAPNARAHSHAGHDH